MKSGWKTTEFWVSLVAALSGVLVTLGLITPEQQNQLTAAVQQVAGGLITIVSVGAYVWSRTHVKKSATTGGSGSEGAGS